MYLAGSGPMPAEYRFLDLSRAPPRAAGRHRGSGAARRRLCERAPDRPEPTPVERRQARRERRSPPRQLAFGDVNLVVPDASSTAEIIRDILRELDVALTPEIAEALYVGLVTDTGRFQYTNTTPKALRLAAELVEAGADVHGIFRHVYETVQFAKLKLLARALERAQLFEGGRLVVSYLLRDDFAEVGAEEPYSEGIIDHLRAVEGSEMVALIREPPRDEGPTRRISLRSSHDEVDVSAIAREAGGGGHRQAAGFSSEQLDRRDHRVPPPRVRAGVTAATVPPRARRPVGIALVDKPAGPSSFAIVAALRRRTGARTGHAGTLDPFATGLLVLLSGAATRLAPCFVGLDKRYVTDVDLTATTSTGDPEGETARAAPGAAPRDARRGARAPPR